MDLARLDYQMRQDDVLKYSVGYVAHPNIINDLNTIIKDDVMKLWYSDLFIQVFYYPTFDRYLGDHDDCLPCDSLEQVIDDSLETIHYYYEHG